MLKAFELAKEEEKKAAASWQRSSSNEGSSPGRSSLRSTPPTSQSGTSGSHATVHQITTDDE